MDYDPESGIFIWKVKSNKHIKVGCIAGCLTKAGYTTIRVTGKLFYGHRLAFLYIKGYLPENEIDHINRIRDDNRWCNLREVGRQCNSRNSSISKANKSGVTGVYWIKSNNKWRASITVNKVLKHLGYYDNISDAIRSRWDAEIEYGFLSCNTVSTAYKYLNENDLLTRR